MNGCSTSSQGSRPRATQWLGSDYFFINARRLTNSVERSDWLCWLSDTNQRDRKIQIAVLSSRLYGVTRIGYLDIISYSWICNKNQNCNKPKNQWKYFKSYMTHKLLSSDNFIGVGKLSDFRPRTQTQYTKNSNDTCILYWHITYITCIIIVFYT